MEEITSTPAGALGLVAAVCFFFIGLFAGSWKYYCIRRSPEATAPRYVDIAHRAALLYSFAAVLIAIVASMSVFPNMVNFIALAAIMTWFTITLSRYVYLGFLNNTDNQHLNPPSRKVELIMLSSVMIVEIGGFTVLAIGFFMRVLADWPSF